MFRRAAAPRPGEMSKSWRLTEIAAGICGVDGAENVRRSLSDWLRFMQLLPASRLRSS